MHNQVCQLMRRPDKELIALAHLVLNTMDKGNNNGIKLIDESKFKASFDACVLAGGFCFPPAPDHKAQNALLSHKLTKVTFNDEKEWCGEHN
jgi:hypothetical protein